MRPFTFPEGFLWGAATSSHQVEGNNTRNDWWDWEVQGKVPERSGAACRHYEFFERDFDSAKALGHNAHRISIEWSRIEPLPGEWNEKEIEHYRRVILALRERGIEPVVTLHHFTNPIWFVRLGGWEAEQSIYHFERYVHKVAANLCGDVRFWITINEPLVLIYHGYLRGEWPPGEKPALIIRVFRNLMLAHDRAYAVIHGTYEKAGKPKPMVGLAQNIPHYAPCRRFSLFDRLSVFVNNLFTVQCFFKSLLGGMLYMPGLLREKLPWKPSLDFIGLNYYTREFVHFKGFRFPALLGELCSKTHHRDTGYRNEMGWESFPEGLYRVLLKLRWFRLPIMITENGTCASEDNRRWEYLRSHIQAVAKAMEKGVPVLGYLCWSLLDNFEWARGFGPRFGLLEMDYKTQERRVRPSAGKFASVCRTNSIDI